ncbi:MAG: oligosaccharide flippase family protein [Solirubrobacteraceae bacterium]
MGELSIEKDESEVATLPDVLDSSAAGGLLIRGGVLRLASYVGIVALSVLSAALLTRHLGVARFGRYTTVLSLVGVVAAITDAGMSTIGTREFAVRSGADRDALMRDLVGLRIALTMVGVLLAAAFALAAGYDASLLAGTVLASLATVALVIQHTYTIPLTTALRLGALSTLELGRQVLMVAGIVALVLVGSGLLPLLSLTLVVNVLLIGPTALLARRQIALKAGARPRHWARLLRVTLAYSLATAVGTIYIYTAQILTSLVAGSHQSGLFAASFRVFIVAGAVPGLLVSGALPVLARAARDDRERLAYAVRRIFDVTLVLGVAAALGTLGGAHFIIAVVGGPRYAGSAAVLRIQGLALVASFPLAGWSFALLSLKRYRGLLVANAIAFATTCCLTLLLASADGADGAALATRVSESVLGFASLFVLVKANRELRPRFAIVAKVGLAAAPAAAIAVFLDIASLGRTLVALAVYAALILATRAVPEELLALLRPQRTSTR